MKEGPKPQIQCMVCSADGTALNASQAEQLRRSLREESRAWVASIDTYIGEAGGLPLLEEQRKILERGVEALLLHVLGVPCEPPKPE